MNILTELIPNQQVNLLIPLKTANMSYFISFFSTKLMSLAVSNMVRHSDSIEGVMTTGGHIAV